MLCMCMYASVSCIYVCKANDREVCMYVWWIRVCVCVNSVVDECVHVCMYICVSIWWVVLRNSLIFHRYCFQLLLPHYLLPLLPPPPLPYSPLHIKHIHTYIPYIMLGQRTYSTTYILYTNAYIHLSKQCWDDIIQYTLRLSIHKYGLGNTSTIHTYIHT